MLRMADWTAEGGALVTETGGSNKCYWTGLHTAERWLGINNGHMPHFKTIVCCYPRTERLAEIRNSLFLVLYGELKHSW